MRYLKAKCIGANSRALWRIKGDSKGGQDPISRIPGGNRVSVKVCAVQVEKLN